MSHVASHRWADLARGKVGDREARRMRAHAASCQACGRARDRVTGGVEAFGEIKRAQAPELGWDTIRTRVYWATSSERRERERTQRMHAIRLRRWSVALIPALAAAAAVAIYLETRSSAPSTETKAPVAIAPRTLPPPPPAPLIGVVTLAQGDVAIDAAASSAKVLAHPVAAGSTVTTKDGKVAVQFGDGSVFEVGPRSALSVRRFDAGAIELALGDTGEVTIEVAPRAPGQRFTVTAGDRTIEVRGTAFHVARRGSTVDVACSHGLVAVRDRSGDLLVPAGQGVVVEDRESLADRAAHPLDAAALESLVGSIGPRLPVWDPASMYRTSAPLAIAAPAGKAIRVDGVLLGTGPLVVRVMSGRHLVEGQWIEAGPGRDDGRIDTRIDLTTVRTATIDTPGPSPAAARAARRRDLEAGIDHQRVDTCVRTLAKQGLLSGTHVELELSVDTGGAINMLNLGDTDLPVSMASCVRDAVAIVRFPRGMSATFSYRFDF
ncbi:MAG TPA: FecR family protein [Kofleriaceae bacterium]|nr:FecR family protein [Kofleriaceae bacterium]